MFTFSLQLRFGNDGKKNGQRKKPNSTKKKTSPFTKRLDDYAKIILPFLQILTMLSILHSISH
jgi:hypothetical protein